MANNRHSSGNPSADATRLASEMLQDAEKRAEKQVVARFAPDPGDNAFSWSGIVYDEEDFAGDRVFSAKFRINGQETELEVRFPKDVVLHRDGKEMFRRDVLNSIRAHLVQKIERLVMGSFSSSVQFPEHDDPA